jgi:hypothetical protein
MSDYLHNLVARSFGLVETAQPRLASLFEPPRAFKPIDALQNNRPREELAHADSEKVQTIASSLETPPAHLNASPTEVVPAAQPSTKRTAAHDMKPRLPRLSSVESAGEEDESSQAISDILSLNQATHPTVVQPSLQREERVQTGPISPAPRAAYEQIIKTGARDSVSDQAEGGRKTEPVMIEPPGHDEGNPAEPYPKRRPQTEARIDETARSHAKPEQLPRLIERVTEQRASEQAHSTRESPPLFSNQPSIDERPLSMSQSMKATALRSVSAFDANSSSRATTENHSRVEMESSARQRPETVIAKPKVSRYVETERPDSFKHERVPEPERVVQVTIGRLEVRAAAAPPVQARASRERAGRAEQSLEEYLRRRAQGG